MDLQLKLGWRLIIMLPFYQSPLFFSSLSIDYNELLSIYLFSVFTAFVINNWVPNIDPYIITPKWHQQLLSCALSLSLSVYSFICQMFLLMFWQFPLNWWICVTEFITVELVLYIYSLCWLSFFFVCGLIDDRLYSAILRSLEQTHCAHMWFYMSAFFEYPPKWCTYNAVMAGAT